MHYAIHPIKITNKLGCIPEIKFSDGIKRIFDYILILMNGSRILLMVNIRISMKYWIEIGKCN